MARDTLYKSHWNQLIGCMLCLLCLGFSSLKAGITQFRPIDEVYLDIELSDASLAQIFKEIEARTDYSFVYNKRLLVAISPLDVSSQGNSLDQVLRSILSGTALTHLQREENIYIFERKVKPVRKPVAPDNNGMDPESKWLPRALSPSIKQAPSEKQKAPRLLKGVVLTEADEQPIVGATVLVKDTRTGVLTGGEGEFTVEIPDNGCVLVVSYYGFEKQEITITDQTDIRVVMKERVASLDPTIVVGYGKQKKSDISSSVGFISTKDLREVPVTTLDQGMQGRVAGVAISQNSAAPGGAVSVRVRGATSFTSNEPLYVIDGVPVFNDYSMSSSLNASGGGQARNVLSTLNPNDIESISILKDASATAIYGARGANGVVLITTKRGTEGRIRVGLDSYVGVQQVWNQWDLLSARAFADLSNDSRRNDGLPIYLGDDPYYQDIPFVDLNTVENTYGEGTDWQGELLGTALTQSHQLSISGGSAKSNYAVMGGYYRQEGVVRNSDFERISLRSNVSSQVADFLKVGTNISVSRTNSNVIPTDGVSGGTSAIIQPTLTFLPTIPVYNEQGEFNRNPPAFFSNLTNPLISINLNENITQGFRILGNGYAEVSLPKGFQLKTSLGTDIVFDETHLLNVAYVQGQGIDPANSSRWMNRNQDNMWVWENTLHHELNLVNHQLSTLLGWSAQEFRRDLQFMSVRNFSSIRQSTISNGSEIINVDGLYQEYALLSSFLRFNYKFQQKYILTATVRRDGSSRFGSANRFGIFPSASVAWNITQEKFAQDWTKISDFKIRASYGLSGNQEIGNYSSVPNMNLVDFAYSFNGNRVLGTWPTSIPNQNLSWEETAQLDLGVDITFLSDRIQLTADYYQKQTSDVLVLQDLPVLAGFPEPVWSNLGRINNQGLELAIKSYNLTGNLKWNTDFNVSYNRNEIIDYPDLDAGERLLITNTANGRIGQTVIQEGTALGNFYGFQTDGIFMNQAEIEAYNQGGELIQPRAQPGDVRFVDLDGNGRIDEGDQTIIGNAFPDVILGLNNRFSLGAWDLSIFLYAQYGNEVFNATRRDLQTMNGGTNQAVTVLDRWRSESNPGNGTIPRATTIDPNNNSRLYSDRWIEDGSFIRCRNITLSYTLPSEQASLLRADLCRLYLTVQNAFTITSYEGFDPEVSSNGQDAFFPGYDLGAYPQSRVMLLGINLGF